MENAEKQLISEIISTYDSYVDLLSKELNSLMGLAVAHGYTGNETAYEQGVALRDKINEFKKMLEK